MDKKQVASVAATVKLSKLLGKFLFSKEERKAEEELRDKSPSMQIVYAMTPVRLGGCKLHEQKRKLPKNIMVSRIRMQHAKRVIRNEEKRKKAFPVLADSESGLKNCLNPDLTLGFKRSLLKSRLALWAVSEGLYGMSTEELDAKIQQEEEQGFQQFLSTCLDAPVDGGYDGADSRG